MLTPEQEKWIAHLSDESKVRIVPFDPSAEEKFKRVRQKLRDALGTDLPVLHRGATSLGISGQDEIDIYIPMPPARFDALVEQLRGILGEPQESIPARESQIRNRRGRKARRCVPDKRRAR
jgi:hypothetical protein